MPRTKWVLITLLTLSAFLPAAQSLDEQTYILHVKAADKFQRSLVANSGASIEQIEKDHVIVLASASAKSKLESWGLVLSAQVQPFAFPPGDDAYHEYAELEQKLKALAQQFPQQAKLFSMGKSVEGRELWALRISGQVGGSSSLPGVFFLGGHHAREHLSVEVPLLLAEHLLNEYQRGDSRIRDLLDSRDITILPSLNPDGAEYDIASGQYRYWRKNRARNGRTFGVDLNRNYSYKWGTGGSSRNSSDETYMGPQPFSEPETQAVKNFIDANRNIKIILSYHTFSELILYPWGHTYNSIADKRDAQVFRKMADQMSQWNGYTPQQSSQLYVASGDMTDWAYGTYKTFAFTFELDPKGWGSSGFYPGPKVIQSVFKKNLEPALYLLEMADNPYKVLP